MTINFFNKILLIPAFECIANGKPLHIPQTISGDYINHAEKIVNISYSQSEKFSSVS